MRIASIAFIWFVMSSVTPAFGGVGDVYYCIPDRGYIWDNSEKTLRETNYPRFSFTQKTENLIEFSDSFMGLTLHPYEIIHDTIVSHGSHTPNHKLWFDGKNFKYTIFQGPILDGPVLDDYIGFFTCSKF